MKRKRSREPEWQQTFLTSGVKCRQPSYKRMRPQGSAFLHVLVAIIIAGLLVVVAFPAYNDVSQRARTTAAVIDLGQIQLALEKFLTVGNGVLPANLAAVGMDTLNDPWGNPYQYLNIEAGVDLAAVHKDRQLVPLNTDYDLYSMGEDGMSRSQLTARASQDDIVRAGNGAFLGLAKDY